MKFLVGANGWIGNQFIDLIKNNYDYKKATSRLDNIEETIIEIENEKHIYFVYWRIIGKIEVKFIQQLTTWNNQEN